MFDPFKDCATAGYLRNKFQENDPRIVKRIEHEVFARHLPNAIQYLSNQKSIVYRDFLAVHRILFAEFYPWAGQDRSVTLPGSAVTKANILFAHPQAAQLAVENGLRLGQTKDVMSRKLGEVMGLFAYGHPFLDGNGRTMLLVHLELAHRAGFSISWERTSKRDYLKALTNEIDSPGRGILDDYLLQFKVEPQERNEWGKNLLAIVGLDGLDDENHVAGDLSDPVVAEKYRQLEARRAYTYIAHDDDVVCKTCKLIPCICDDQDEKTDHSTPDMGA